MSERDQRGRATRLYTSERFGGTLRYFFHPSPLVHYTETPAFFSVSSQGSGGLRQVTASAVGICRDLP